MNPISRRQLLKTTTATLAATIIPSAVPNAVSFAQEKDKLFKLDPLPYKFDALEPHIDAKTMEIHHGKHHQAYVDNLNKQLVGTAWAGLPVESIIKELDKIPEGKRAAVRNNGGGHYNHTLFWQMMAPPGTKPEGDLLKAIEASFKDVESMLKALKEASLARFGSGWGWVVLKDGKLAIVSTPNQDNPLMEKGGGIPILGVDVWEHAYYLKYQNKRADYLDAFFKVINWKFVAELFEKAKKA